MKLNKNQHAGANRRLAVLLLCSLFILSCNLKDVPYIKGFDNDLQGTWETNDADEYYTGALAISSNAVTISGYAPNAEYEFTNGNGTGQRPFKDFTKNAPLEAYAEEGKIFIKDAGVMQEMPYIYYLGAYSPIENKQPQFLRFSFGGREETLRKQ